MYKILLIEKDQAVLNFLTDAVDDFFSSLCCFENSSCDDAVQKADSFSPDIIFINNNMQNDGNKLLMQLHLIAPSSAIVLITDEQKPIDFGGGILSGLLFKPLSKDKLLVVMRHIFDINDETNAELAVKRALRYVKNNFDRDIKLEQLSKELKMSPYYISKIFKEYCGVNFVNYLTYLRMEKASRLLRDTLISVKEVCYTVGYCDPNYFSRKFKQHFGVSPSEYRSRHKDNIIHFN